MLKEKQFTKGVEDAPQQENESQFNPNMETE